MAHAATESLQPVPAKLTLVAEPDAVPANGHSVAVLTATLLDAKDQPIRGVRVNFRTTAGRLYSPWAPTDRKGQAHNGVIAPTAPVVAKVTAEAAGLRATVEVVFYSDKGAQMQQPPPGVLEAKLHVHWIPDARQPEKIACAYGEDRVAGGLIAKVGVIVDAGTIRCPYVWYQEMGAGHPTEPVAVSVLPDEEGRAPDPDIDCDPHPEEGDFGCVFEALDGPATAWPDRHNWNYRVWADCTWKPLEGPTEHFTVEICIKDTEDPSYITIDNLTVTVDTNPPTYPPCLLWDPTDPDGTQGRTRNKLRFRLDSAQAMTAKATIRLYPLDRPDGDETPIRQEILTRLAVPTQNQYEEWTWDGKDNQDQTMPKGIYPFNVSVEGEQQGEYIGGQDQKKSEFLAIPEMHGYIAERDEVNQQTTVLLRYRLQSDRAASEVHVEWYNSTTLAYIDDAGPLPGQVGWNYAEVTLPTAVFENATFVLFATDNHADREKAHRLKPALQRGLDDDDFVDAVELWAPLEHDSFHVGPHECDIFFKANVRGGFTPNDPDVTYHVYVDMDTPGNAWLELEPWQASETGFLFTGVKDTDQSISGNHRARARYVITPAGGASHTCVSPWKDVHFFQLGWPYTSQSVVTDTYHPSTSWTAGSVGCLLPGCADHGLRHWHRGHHGVDLDSPGTGQNVYAAERGLATAYTGAGQSVRVLHSVRDDNNVYVRVKVDLDVTLVTGPEGDQVPSNPIYTERFIWTVHHHLVWNSGVTGNVARGAVIGREDTTGTPKSHLHFGVLVTTQGPTSPTDPPPFPEDEWDSTYTRNPDPGTDYSYFYHHGLTPGPQTTMAGHPIYPDWDDDDPNLAGPENDEDE